MSEDKLAAWLIAIAVALGAVIGFIRGIRRKCVFFVCMCLPLMLPIHEVVAQNSFQWTMQPGESMVEWDRRLDESVEDRIQCSDPSFLVRAVVAGGEYEIIALEQSGILMCGWKTNLFEMFVVDRKGCMVKKKDRWWMNNIDAKRVRECFDLRRISK